MLLDPLRIDPVGHFAVEAGHVQADRLRVAGQGNQLEVVGPGKQQMVHRPELPLRGCRFGRLGGQRGVRVNLHLRKVPEHESQPLAEGLHEVLRHRFGLHAGRAFVVAVFEQRQRRVGVALAVIGGAQRHHGACGGFGVRHAVPRSVLAR